MRPRPIISKTILICLVTSMMMVFQNATPSLDPAMWGRTLFERLAGRPPNESELNQMVTLIRASKTAEATSFAMSNTDFVNITARAFCAEMSTRDESPVEVFNDFTATCMGIFRDNLPATDFLTANYTYVLDAAQASAKGIPVYNAGVGGGIPTQSILDSESEPYQFTTYHYKSVEGKDYALNVSDALVKSNGQKILTNKETGATKPLPDPAGLLTSTSFIGSHAYAGTNRRIIEYAFREFLCQPVTEMMDTSVSEAWVGRDVTREPGGDPTIFTTNCRGCHGIVDGMRGAFAYFTWTGLGVSYETAAPQAKYNQNRHMFPAGRITTGTEFLNQANGTSNSKYFGWRGALAGSGAAEFGRMVSQSQAFSRCMVRRAFRSVCFREPTYQETKTFITGEAVNFENDRYNLKNMFGRVATNSTCINPIQAE